MSESNVKKLKNAYRHPFEYISPLLYRKNNHDRNTMSDEAGSALAFEHLFVASEEEFTRLSKLTDAQVKT